MVLEKIEHYLRLAFFFILVLTQSMIFVAGRAADNSALLEVVFIEPVSGQTIKAGDRINLQAQLSTAKDSDLSVAYFSVINLFTGYNQNFEAYQGQDDIWRSSVAWDTSILTSGQYILSVTAYVYKDGHLQDMYRSEPQVFDLISDKIEVAASISQPVFTSPSANQVVATTNLDVTVTSVDVLSNIVFNIKSWNASTNSATGDSLKTFAGDSLGSNLWGARQVDVSSLASGAYVVSMIADKDDGVVEGGDVLQGATISQVSAQVVFSINQASPVSDISDEPSLAATLVSPQAEQVVSGSILTKLELNRILTTDESLSAKIYDNSLSLVKELALAKSSNPLVYQATLDSTILSNAGTAIYPDGRYRLEIILDKASNDIKLNTVNFSIKNNSSSDVNSTNKLNIKTPVVNAVIKDNKILVEATTDFEADELKVSLVNKSDPAIGISDTSIPKLDGYSWSGIVNLGDTFIDGTYRLSFSAFLASQELASSSISLALNRQDSNSIPTPQDIKVSIINKRANLSGTDFLVVAANVSSLDFYCTLTNSLDNTKTKDVMAVAMTWSQLAGMGIKQADYPDTGYVYLASFDTKDLLNGNYKVVAKNKAYPEVTSKLVYVSIFNQVVESANDTQASSSDELLEKKLSIDSKYEVASDGQTANFYIDADFLTQANNLFVFRADTSDLIKEDSFQKETASGSGGQYRYTYTLGLDGLAEGKYYLYAVEYAPGTKTTLAESKMVNFNIVAGRFVSPVADNEAGDNSEETQYKVSDTFRGWGVGPYASCLDAYLEDENYCKIFRAWQSSVDESCIAQNILDWPACEDYLNRTQVDTLCQAQGIIDKEKCKDYLIEKYTQNIDCRLVDPSECTQVLRSNFINYLAVKTQSREILSKVVADLPDDRHIKVKDLAAKLASQGLDKNVLPFASNVEAQVLVEPALAEIVLADKEALDVTSPILLMVDTDGDGLPDDLEKYYGSDPNKTDTDDDSYSDFTELANGYNPAGAGKLEQARTGFEQALFNKATWEQPQLKSTKTDVNLNVLKLKDDNGQFRISGKAEANTLLTLYFYSQVPLLSLVKADALGNWSYDLSWALSDGYHRVYVATVDSSGAIIKQSEPTAFVVKDGQPVKIREYFAATTAPTAEERPWLFYIFGGLGLVALFIFIMIIIRRIKKTSATPV